jgi:hypothetical protein
LTVSEEEKGEEKAYTEAAEGREFTEKRNPRPR